MTGERDARDSHPSAVIDIVGGGRVAGVVITRDPPDQGASAIEYAGGRFRECASPGCGTPGIVNFQFPMGESRTLQPGDYRVYLLADESPVRVVLRLTGIDGRARLVPSEKAHVDIQTPFRQLATVDPTTYSAGAEVRTSSAGVVLAMMSLEGSRESRYANGICSYSGSRPPPQVAYGPQCGALLAARHIGTYSGARRYTMVYLAYHSGNTLPPNTDGYRGIGVWALTNGAIGRASSQVLAIPFP